MRTTEQADVQIRVSVVMPVYQGQRYLEVAINSVRAQTFRNWELLIIDDGSSDDSFQIAKNLSRMDSRIGCRQQIHGGAARARNHGIREAKGKYVAFLDADDFWHPDMLNETVGLLNGSASIDVARTAWFLIEENGIGPLTRQSEVQGAAADSELENLLVENNLVPAATLTRLSCIEGVGGFDESLTAEEDWDLWIRISASGGRFGFINRPLAMYRKYDGGVTSDHIRMRKNRLRVLKKIFSAQDVLKGRWDLEKQAFAKVEQRACVEAFRGNDPANGLLAFDAAVAWDRDTLTNEGIYYQIGASKAGEDIGQTSSDSRLSSGMENCLALIDHVENSPVGLSLSEDDVKETIATIHFVIGMLAYSARNTTSDDYRILASAHFKKSIRSEPKSLNTWIWLVRGMVGRNRIGRLNRLRARIRRPHQANTELIKARPH